MIKPGLKCTCHVNILAIGTLRPEGFMFVTPSPFKVMVELLYFCSNVKGCVMKHFMAKSLFAIVVNDVELCLSFQVFVIFP